MAVCCRRCVSERRISCEFFGDARALERADAYADAYAGAYAVLRMLMLVLMLMLTLMPKLELHILYWTHSNICVYVCYQLFCSFPFPLIFTCHLSLSEIPRDE